MQDLPSFPQLSQISAASLALIEETRRTFTVEPRETVIQLGETVARTYFITAGHLRAFVQDGGGREKTLYHVGPGQTCILAVNCSFSGVPYPAWVASGEETTRGFVLPATTFKRLFESEPVVRDFTVGVLTSWIFDLMTWIEETTLGSMQDRLARVLIRRADANGLVWSTHQDLANDLGTAREVISRHLKEFEASACIERGRQRVKILNRSRLLEGGSVNP